MEDGNLSLIQHIHQPIQAINSVRVQCVRARFVYITISMTTQGHLIHSLFPDTIVCHLEEELTCCNVNRLRVIRVIEPSGNRVRFLGMQSYYEVPWKLEC